MPDITHDLLIDAPVERIFDAMTTPEGVSEWWSRTTEGDPRLGSQYRLDFGPDYQWRATVMVCKRPHRFEWKMVECDDDWQGTRVGFELEDQGAKTIVRFRHAGWADADAHFRISSYCWAMYLRILKRFVEHGERVPWKDRLDV